ncbi:HEAT repeat domain-containing protein [Roseibium sp.]
MVFEPFEDESDFELLADKLGEDDPAVRRVAVMDLADTADPEAIPLIASTVKDESPEVRLQAAIALGEFDGLATATALCLLLQDTDNRVI